VYQYQDANGRSDIAPEHSMDARALSTTTVRVNLTASARLRDDEGCPGRVKLAERALEERERLGAHRS